jgi:hypothetical protein
VAGEDAGVPGRGWRPGHQPFRSLEGGQRADLVAGDPAVAAQAGQQLSGPTRLGVRVHPAQRVLNQLDRSLGGAAEGNRLGRPGQQIDQGQSRRLAGLRHPLPQLEGSLVVARRLGKGVGMFGGQPGPDSGCQGLRRFAGCVPMGGELGCGHSRRGVGQFGQLGQHPGKGGVEAGPLARQQVGVDDLP